MEVIKRNGKYVKFDVMKIISAVERAMLDTDGGVDVELSHSIGESIEEHLLDYITPAHVEEIQDIVEFKLMESHRKDVAKNYILYRNHRSEHRKSQSVGILSEDFISKYKSKQPPMTELGSIVYYRTYSRWLGEEGRREYWWETVKRAVEYNCSLAKTTVEEAEKLFDNIFHLRQFLSGRTFWVGGTDVSKRFITSNYNCCGIVVDDMESFRDLFYLLLVGAGVGVRILKEDIKKLPTIKTNVELKHMYYDPVKKKDRVDHTSFIFKKDDEIEIVVGDSKNAWSEALNMYFNILWDVGYRQVKTVNVNYNYVRPKGEKLKTFGGKASGHESLKVMFDKIHKLISSKVGKTYKLKPIDCLDIANIIGENVVCGGVRRTSEIALMDTDDEECINAKNNLYTQEGGAWKVDKDIIHRQMSNNSIFYREKPTREKLKWHMEKMRYTGEPGFVNEEAALKRNPNFKLVNPCAEILMDSRGMCNLTTINVMAFVKYDESDIPKLDLQGLLKAQGLSARAGLRMTTRNIELPKWDMVQQRDRLLGCSITGWQDMVNALSMSREEESEVLRMLRNEARTEADKYANQLGLNKPLLITTVKPEGSLSQLPTVSSGVHFSHSPHYVRRVRISSTDHTVKACEDLGYPVFPEVGQDWETCSTKVVEFPVKAPEGRTKYDVSAIEQLEIYKMFMENYVDHNVSITIHVREHEWGEVEEWVWDNWDGIVAISFLSLDDSFYQLLPYESISKEEYEERKSKMNTFLPSLISKYEKQEVEIDVGDESCESGVCPIR